MKRFSTGLLLVCLVLILTVSVTAADRTEDVVILFTNDTHCAVNDHIGFAGLAAYREELEAAGHEVILVDGGDAIQGAPIGSVSEGAFLVDIMNRIGYDVKVPGNHEFDYGLDALMQHDRTSDHSYICCNFIDKNGNTVFSPYRLVTCGSLTIGFVGITTPDSFSSSSPISFQDARGNFIYSFCEDATGQALYNAVQTAVDAAAAEADYVVAVGHLGMDGSVARWRSDAVIANTTGIDVFLDAHSHEVIPAMTVKNKDQEPVLLASAGSELEHIGKLTISADGTMKTELISDYTKKDAETAAYLDSIHRELDKFLQDPVAECDIALTAIDADGGRIVRTRETNLGDFCADAYRYVTDADVAIINSGSIRANVAAGTATISDMINVNPFNDVLCVAEVTGQTILDALELGARTCPAENGAFLQVSGMTYEIHTYLPSGVKLDEKGRFIGVDGEYRVKNVQIQGRPLQLNGTYTLGTRDFLIKEFGDGYAMFQGAKLVRDSIMLDNEGLIEYAAVGLNGHIGSAYAAPQGRIRIFSTPYADVSADSWYGPHVQYVHDAGLMNGTGSAAFSPTREMSRAMLVTMLYRLDGSPSVGGAVSERFSDCAEGAWYADAVLWASQNDIIAGNGDGTFSPAAPVSREAMAKILYGYALYTGGSTVLRGSLEYADAQTISEWALPGVCYCTENGILQGSGGCFAPKRSATRAMGAKVLHLLAQK